MGVVQWEARERSAQLWSVQSDCQEKPSTSCSVVHPGAQQVAGRCSRPVAWMHLVLKVPDLWRLSQSKNGSSYQVPGQTRMQL